MEKLKDNVQLWKELPKHQLYLLTLLGLSGSAMILYGLYKTLLGARR